MKIPAVVYLSETGSGFGTIRSLAARGIRVIGLNPRVAFTSRSRYFKDERCPSPEKDAQGFIDRLAALGERIGPSALFLSDDLAVFLVSKNRARLESKFLYPYLNDRVLFASLDKSVMYDICVRAGVPAPLSFRASSEKDLAQGERFRFPVVIKPVVSRFTINGAQASKPYLFREIFGFARCIVARDPAKMYERAGKAIAAGLEVLLQEEIQGPQEGLYACSFYVDRQGRVRGISTHRKIRQMPADFGIASLKEIIDCPEIEESTRRFVVESGMRGFGSVEFKWDERDKIFKFIEINPRAIHSILLSCVNDCDFPVMQYADMTGEIPFPKVLKPKTKKGWFHLQGELDYIATYGWDRRSPYYVSAWAWWRSLTSKPMVEAYISWSDPLLSVAYVWRCVVRFAKKWVKNLLRHVFRIRVGR